MNIHAHTDVFRRRAAIQHRHFRCAFGQAVEGKTNRQTKFAVIFETQKFYGSKRLTKARNKTSATENRTGCVGAELCVFANLCHASESNNNNDDDNDDG
jgi:hypothetical protein